ncbi:hypothetical protein HB364_14075 [Pseudoflavitalea sp. X16]|uniref:hypothetical protein n=1 Tax=Paraflavitalea devenefica TaxID=2716334 RepID=UPI00141D9601|nr:hypothetical protein [Paraflavitalea devenefica]NII26217.1 hypothetical protein [Paraflavitalea devenefica]
MENFREVLEKYLTGKLSPAMLEKAKVEGDSNLVNLGAILRHPQPSRQAKPPAALKSPNDKKAARKRLAQIKWLMSYRQAVSTATF